MELKVIKVPTDENESMVIKCHKITDEISEIVSFIKSRQGVLSGKKDGHVGIGEEISRSE